MRGLARESFLAGHALPCARDAEGKAPFLLSDVKFSLVARSAATKLLNSGMEAGRLSGPKGGLGDLVVRRALGSAVLRKLFSSRN